MIRYTMKSPYLLTMATKLSSKIAIAGGAVLVLAVGAGWLVWSDISRERTEGEPAVTEPPQEREAMVKIERTNSPPTEDSSSHTQPDLDRPITVSANLSAEAVAYAVDRIKEMTAELRKDAALFSSWLELAVNRKAIGDHRAAEEIWLFVADRWAGNPIAHSNLADLYLTVFRDDVKAERHLLAAIARAPGQIIFYENAYSFYRFVKKDLKRAAEILEEGIKKNSGNAAGLKQFLGEFKEASEE